MKEKLPKWNRRGAVVIRAETYALDRDKTGKVIGLKSNGIHSLQARDVFSNEELNALDQIRWQHERDLS